jgi:hypothetical protein
MSVPVIAPQNPSMATLEELRLRLSRLGLRQSRKWLAEQSGYRENSIRQYLGPKGRSTPKFLREALRAVEEEETRQRLGSPDAPPWNLLFRTQVQFGRADRASRAQNAESLEEFCRDSLLHEAGRILGRKPGAIAKSK